MVLVRTGWARRWDDREAYVGQRQRRARAGRGGRALAGRRSGARAVGADTIAFEQLAPGAGHALLPAHRVLLVEHGIHIIETLNLEELADGGRVRVRVRARAAAARRGDRVAGAPAGGGRRRREAGR